MPRFRFFGLVSALALLASPALAVQSPARAARAAASGVPVVSSGGLEAAPGRPVIRREPEVSWGAPGAGRRAAWERFLRGAGPDWQALWDRDTGAPLRVIGAGILAPGTVAGASAAEAHARAFLTERGDLLAPGLAAENFVLVADDLDQGLRTVAFEERARVAGVGLVPVAGGRASVRYRNDRLFVFASEALPLPPELPAPRIDAASAELAASAWIAGEHGSAVLLEGASLVALPLVGSGRVEVRPAYRIVIDAFAPRARWAAYVDARDGRPLARDQLLRFAAASVLFDAPVRAPQFDRKTWPAALLTLQIDGSGAETDAQGSLAFTPQSPDQLVLGAHGKTALVSNLAGLDISATFPLLDGTPVTWSMAGDEFGDAQLSSYIHAGIVKEHARGIAPAMTFLDGVLPVHVNEDDPQGCNAFWDGNAVNFLRQNETCNNTARLADVVYHEFGHGFHQHAVITGTGALDPALGEGTGDTMATSVTRDPQLSPGFFLGSDTPLREVDSGRRWPDDISFDPHETGLIWAGAVWDLRQALVKDLGDAAGNALAEQLFYQAIRRSSSIPTTYAEVLAADDDDGDLANGTPHICAINRAFVAHGIASVLDESGLVLHHDALSVVPAHQASYPLSVTWERLYPSCAQTPIDGVSVRWHASGAQETISLTADGSSFKGAIPAQIDGASLRYTVVASVGGFAAELPDNRADDEYRLFVGDVTPLYCNDFETQIDGWTFDDIKGGAGDFQWGSPSGKAGDPPSAYSGSRVIGDRLSGNGAYSPSRTVSAESPVIDLQGQEAVRLQFRRWLGVDDGALDQATIYVNDSPVWQNAGTDPGDGSLSLADKEWRFEDIDLRSFVAGSPTAQVRFELVSDASRQLGGWTIDDFCLVAWKPAAGRIKLPVGTPKPAEPIDGDPARDGCACSSASSEGGSIGWLWPAIAAALAIGRRRRR